MGGWITENMFMKETEGLQRLCYIWLISTISVSYTLNVEGSMAHLKSILESSVMPLRAVATEFSRYRKGTEAEEG